MVQIRKIDGNRSQIEITNLRRESTDISNRREHGFRDVRRIAVRTLLQIAAVGMAMAPAKVADASSNNKGASSISSQLVAVAAPLGFNLQQSMELGGASSLTLLSNTNSASNEILTTLNECLKKAPIGYGITVYDLSLGATATDSSITGLVGPVTMSYNWTSKEASISASLGTSVGATASLPCAAYISGTTGGPTAIVGVSGNGASTPSVWGSASISDGSVELIAPIGVNNPSISNAFNTYQADFTTGTVNFMTNFTNKTTTINWALVTASTSTNGNTDKSFTVSSGSTSIGGSSTGSGGSSSSGSTSSSRSSSTSGFGTTSSSSGSSQSTSTQSESTSSNSGASGKGSTSTSSESSSSGTSTSSVTSASSTGSSGATQPTGTTVPPGTNVGQTSTGVGSQTANTYSAGSPYEGPGEYISKSGAPEYISNASQFNQQVTAGFLSGPLASTTDSTSGSTDSSGSGSGTSGTSGSTTSQSALVPFSWSGEPGQSQNPKANGFSIPGFQAYPTNPGLTFYQPGQTGYMIQTVSSDGIFYYYKMIYAFYYNGSYYTPSANWKCLWTIRTPQTCRRR